MSVCNSEKTLEIKIIEVAKQLFIENGFEETSMSDIAQRVGINRPALHYYFRTKDKMFQAVFGSIVLSFANKIPDIILRQDEPISERIGKLVDTYYQVFKENPCLPLFMAKEMQRDMAHLANTVREIHLGQHFYSVRDGLQAEMESGRLKTVPLPFVFYTFYGLLVMPFMVKNLNIYLFLSTNFDGMLEQWKPYVVSQMTALLEKERVS